MMIAIRSLKEEEIAKDENARLLKVPAEEVELAFAAEEDTQK